MDAVLKPLLRPNAYEFDGISLREERGRKIKKETQGKQKSRETGDGVLVVCFWICHPAFRF
jgi:hypothetical protein